MQFAPTHPEPEVAAVRLRRVLGEDRHEPVDDPWGEVALGVGHDVGQDLRKRILVAVDSTLQVRRSDICPSGAVIEGMVDPDTGVEGLGHDPGHSIATPHRINDPRRVPSVVGRSQTGEGPCRHFRTAA
jgi:hypothetical protein